jgi:hypothetical protein
VSETPPLPITYICVCGKKLGFPEAHSGQPTKCPFCGDPFVIPGDALPPAVAPPKPSPLVAQQPPAPTPTALKSIHCDKCQGSNVKRLAVVHAEGI